MGARLVDELLDERFSSLRFDIYNARKTCPQLPGSYAYDFLKSEYISAISFLLPSNT